MYWSTVKKRVFSLRGQSAGSASWWSPRAIHSIWEKNAAFKNCLSDKLEDSDSFNMKIGKAILLVPRLTFSQHGLKVCVMEQKHSRHLSFTKKQILREITCVPLFQLDHPLLHLTVPP